MCIQRRDSQPGSSATDIRRPIMCSLPTATRFHIMGGECNYLLRVTPGEKRLEFVPDDEWQTPDMKGWDETVRILVVHAKLNLRNNS